MKKYGMGERRYSSTFLTSEPDGGKCQLYKVGDWVGSRAGLDAVEKMTVSAPAGNL
jgi:hypothetical protein